RLAESGVWDSPRISDGIEHLRVARAAPDRLRVCGRIFEIDDQSLHSFWLDLERDPSRTGASWTLCFDVIASSPRRIHNAVDTFCRAEDIEWRIRLEGTFAP